MKIQELHQKSDSELKTALNENKEKLQGLKFNLTSGKVKNVSEIRKLRKDIARILTLLKSKIQSSNVKQNPKSK